MLVAKDVIREPFAVINADDYYGAGSFKLISDFLINECTPKLMAMVGYTLSNTLSDHGTVNRGVCKVDKYDNLIEVIERTKISTNSGGVVNYNVGASIEDLGIIDKDAIVSMNYWGFHPDIFADIERGLHLFIKENSNNPKAEYYIPNVVTDMIMARKIDVRVISTNDNWFGVTYKEDKPMAVSAINQCILDGIYPKKLWI